MLGTSSLDTIMTLASDHGWRLVLVGDPRQLQAVGRGGMFDELCRDTATHELATIHRFAHQWEQAASFELRRGSPAALDQYFDRERVEAASFPTLQVGVAHQWVEHHDAGRTVAVVAETNAHVDSLNIAIQAARRDRGHLGRSSTRIAGIEQAFVGDHIVTRRNDRTLRTDHGETVRNRDRWTVERVGPDGSLTVSHLGGQGAVTLPIDYVRGHVRLGYAATAHGNQGDTLDVGFTIVTPATSQRSLYVGATRGRQENRLLVVADDIDDARDVLEQVLTIERADVPAVVRRRDLVAQIDGRPGDACRAPGLDAGHRQAPEPTADERVEACRAIHQRAILDCRPFAAALGDAQRDLDEAERALARLQFRRDAGGPLTKVRMREALREATEVVETATVIRDGTAERAEPHLDALERAKIDLDAARLAARLDRGAEALQSRGPQREASGLGIG